MGRNFIVQHQGESYGVAFSQTEVLAEDIILFVSPPPTEPQSQQAGAISETPSAWLTLFSPPWWFSEVLPHPNFGPTQAVSSGFSRWMVCLGPCFKLSKFSQTSSIWLQWAPYHLLSCPRTGISSSWPWFTTWPQKAPPSPAQVAPICTTLWSFVWPLKERSSG